MELVDIAEQLDREATGTTISIHAGFPNPAAERNGTILSLDKLLVRSPISTYFFRIRGHSWHRYGVFDGDLAIVDRSLTPKDNDLAVWWQPSGELCISRREQIDSQTIWGVITAIVHTTR